MIEKVRLPRKLSEEPMAPPPRRPSHRKVIENIERWANSPALRPPEWPERTRRDGGEVIAEKTVGAHCRRSV